MRLRYTTSSPFARKVLVTAHEHGIQEQLQLEPTQLLVEDHDFWAENPLSKVPVLRTSDGDIYADSAVICEYLDATYGSSKLFHASGANRWRGLTLAALADGTMEAGVMIRREGMRGDGADQQLIGFETDRVQRGLDRIQQTVVQSSSQGQGDFDYGTLTAACCIGWFEFRFGGEFVFANRPALEEWWRNASTRPSLRATEPK